MKVILAQDVKALGKVGDLVKVSDGYARNFLLPRRLAMEATETRVKEFKHLQTMIEAKKKKAQGAAKKVAEQLATVTITLKVQAGEQDKLFGSVTTADIANELAKAGHEFDRRDIKLDEPIKMLGQYRVTVHVAHGVEATVKINVEREAAHGDQSSAAKH